MTARQLFAVFCVLFATLSLPIGWTAANRLRSDEGARTFAYAERRGVQRIDELRALFALMYAEREARDLDGTRDRSRTARIRAAIGALDIREDRDPLAGQAWRTFAAAAREAPLAARTFDALLAAIVSASERSRLSYDPNVAALDLDDAASYRLPAALEAFGRADLGVHRGLRRGRLSVAERLDLTGMLAKGAGAARFGFDDLTEAGARDPALVPALDDAQAAARRASQRFADDAFAAMRTETIPPAAFARLHRSAQAATATLTALQRRLAPALDAMVQRRIHALDVNRGLTIARALGAVALLAILALLAWRSLAQRRDFARIRREAERFASEARFRVVFERAATGIVVVDRGGTVLEANPTFERMMGYPARYFIGKRMSQHTVEDDRGMTLDQFSAITSNAIDGYAYEKRYVRADGSVMWADVTVSKLGEEHPSNWFAIGLIEDITIRKAAEEQLLYAATHDALTGLPNRSFFVAQLDALLERGADARAAAIFIDLDHFKVINDSLGHAAGDRLLQTVADRLREAAGPGDTVARFGGDEFAVLFGDLAHVADLTRRVNAIEQRIAEPLLVEGRPMFTSASIGVAPLSRRYTRAEDVLRDADTAMYRAKADGRARAAIFDNAMYEGALRRLALTSDLRMALANGELCLAYQPLVRLADRTTLGYEALLRWRHPRDGVLLPDEFISLAEETGLIVPIGRWALDEAIRHLANLQRESPQLAMHVNLSVQEVMLADTAAYIYDALVRHGVRPASLIVEITESAVIESTRIADTCLRRLREVGVGVCIDDFGVGYSSLRYLHRFPISGLKIDRSFVNGADDGLASEPIVRMLLDLARTLGIDVIAEGIESERQAAALQLLGCIHGQGFLFSQPRIADDADRQAARLP